MQNKNSTKFYYNNKTKIKQGYDKKMYPKLMWNKLKIMGILPLFIPQCNQNNMYHNKCKLA
jgi:hypothetical protein